MALVVYSVLGIALILRCHYGLAIPPDLFATKVRDYGFLLLLIPAAWSVFVIWESHKPATDHWDNLGLFLSSFGAVVILFAIAISATHSATINRHPHAAYSYEDWHPQ